MTTNSEDKEITIQSTGSKDEKEFFTDPLPFWDYFFKGIPLIFLRISTGLVRTACLFFLRKYNNSTLSASIGVSNDIFVSINNIGIIACGELMGIYAGEYQGAKNFEKMREVWSIGLTISSSLTLISAIIFWFSKPILLWLNFDEAISDHSSTLLRWMIPFIFVQTFSDSLRNWVSLFKCNKSQIVTNIISYPIIILSAWLLIPHYKEKAFGMVRCILESVTFVLLAIVSYVYSCKEAILPGKISSIKELMNFFIEFSKMLTGSMIQIFGNVLNTMMVGSST